jgi:hypothetical protein
MGISHTLFRRFFWVDNILWKEDLEGHNVTVVLAGQDLIVDTEAVARYLTGEDDLSKLTTGEGGEWKGKGLDVIWFQNLDHAQVFDGRETRDAMIDRTCHASRREVGESFLIRD